MAELEIRKNDRALVWKNMVNAKAAVSKVRIGGYL